jgi:hypothetical protein
VKRAGRGESIRAIILICMEMTQKNSLCGYLYLKLAKTSFFSFYFCVSSTKWENRRTKQVLPRGRGQLAPVYVCVGRVQLDFGERFRKMNMPQTIYTHVCKCKTDTY